MKGVVFAIYSKIKVVISTLFDFKGYICPFNCWLYTMLKDYNASIEHYWAPYLVESNSDHPMNHRFSQEQILRVHAIENHARHWTNADILVFNSHRWWRRPKVKVL